MRAGKILFFETFVNFILPEAFPGQTKIIFLLNKPPNFGLKTGILLNVAPILISYTS